MIAGEVGCCTRATVDQRAQSRICTNHIGLGQCGPQGGVDGAEEEVDLDRRRLGHIRDRARRLLIGEPQVNPAQLGGQGKDEPVGLPRYRDSQRRGRIAEGRRVENQVRAPTGPQPDRGVDLRGPHSGRIDHHPGSQVQGLTRQLVGQSRRRSGRGGDAHARQYPSTVGGSSACYRHHQPGIVDQLSVVGQQRTVKPIAAHGRSHRHGLLGADPARPRQDLGGGAGHGAQHVPGQKSGSHQRPLGPAHRRQQWHQLRHRLNQVRRGDRHQDAALDRTAAGDADIAAGQVAQAAVGQFRTPAAGAESEVVCLHQHHRQPPTGGVQGDAGTGDAATDDEDVDGR